MWQWKKSSLTMGLTKVHHWKSHFQKKKKKERKASEKPILNSKKTNEKLPENEKNKENVLGNDKSNLEKKCNLGTGNTVKKNLGKEAQNNKDFKQCCMILNAAWNEKLLDSKWWNGHVLIDA